MAKPKKLTKAEKAAKAKAYNARTTEPMLLDIWAAGGEVVHEGLNYSVTKDKDTLVNNLSKNYLAFDPSTGEIDIANLTKGWGGTVNRALEKKGFKMLGIKGPRSNLDTAGDIADHIAYYMSTYFAQKEATDMYTKHSNAYHAMNGIDLTQDGWDAWQPEKMFEQKITPYVIQKFVRKIPQVKRIFAKINKVMG